MEDKKLDWRPRGAGGVIQSESEGLRSRGVHSINPSLRAIEAEVRCLSSYSEAIK